MATLPISPHANILIIEDEAHLAQGMLFNLQAEGYEATVAADGEIALQWLLADQQHFDAIILDVMLPGQDGFAVATALRAAQNYTPVLMLTARGRPEDILAGFAAGADDYLTKPFDLSILLARLHGLLRRMRWLPAAPASPTPPADSSDSTAPTHPPATPASPEMYRFSGKTIDFSLLEMRTASKQIRLTLMEADLLRYLIQNSGRAIARKEILEQVWHLHEDTDTRAIDNFIVRLRRYMEDDPSQPVHLQTIRGVGYLFLPDADSRR